MPFSVLQAHVLKTEQAGSDMYGIDRGQKSSIQNVNFHLHLRLDFPFQIKLGEGAEQTHVAMYASVDIAEFTKEVLADGRKKERLHSHEAR